MKDPLDDREIDRTIVTSVLAVVAIALLLYTLYFGLYVGMPVGRPEAWGQFGDYLGGMVNPAVGVATVLLVARTLHATRKEAKDTRDELVTQTAVLRRQVEGFEKQEHLKVIEARLGGVLKDWNEEMLAPIGPVPPLGSEMGKTAERFSESTYEFLLRVDASRDLKFGLLSDMTEQRALAMWNSRFEEVLQLLDEFSLYCGQYEARSGEKATTDYYRRRIQKPLRKLKEIGIVENSVFESLKVGMKFREYL